MENIKKKKKAVRIVMKKFKKNRFLSGFTYVLVVK